jgi:peptidoglycan/xylan/chitin deacetylase (PgdA/CDA1 family)
MYHRIAEPLVDPWRLAVQPSHFDEQLAVLRRCRYPLPMSEFVVKIEDGTLPDNAVAVTFDDGYVDNVRAARPRLAANDVPATFFVVSGTIGSAREYWWDELARAVLLADLPVDGEIAIASERYRVSLPARVAADETGWHAFQEPRTERHGAYMDIWQRLQTASPEVRDASMQALRELFSPAPARGEDLPMTCSDLGALAADDRFEIGGHTSTHPPLTALAPAARRDEILKGKLACEQAIHRPLRGFAYPHGAWDADCRSAVSECGFAWACSTESRSVPRSDVDRYALPRLWVRNWDGDTFEHALRAASS